MWAEVNPLAYFSAKWLNNQPELEFSQTTNIAYNFGKAFTAPMHELVNKYTNFFIKPGKLAIRAITWVDSVTSGIHYTCA